MKPESILPVLFLLTGIVFTAVLGGCAPRLPGSTDHEIPQPPTPSKNVRDLKQEIEPDESDAREPS